MPRRRNVVRPSLRVTPHIEGAAERRERDRIRAGHGPRRWRSCPLPGARPPRARSWQGRFASASPSGPLVCFNFMFASIGSIERLGSWRPKDQYFVEIAPCCRGMSASVPARAADRHISLKSNTTPTTTSPHTRTTKRGQSSSRIMARRAEAAPRHGEGTARAWTAPPSLRCGTSCPCPASPAAQNWRTKRSSPRVRS